MSIDERPTHADNSTIIGRADLNDIEAILSVSDTIWLLGRSSAREGGASIVKTMDLMERGIAWSPDVRAAAAYAETRRELEARFLEL